MREGENDVNETTLKKIFRCIFSLYTQPAKTNNHRGWRVYKGLHVHIRLARTYKQNYKLRTYRNEIETKWRCCERQSAI